MSYQLRTLKAPRLTGRALAMFSRAMEGAATRGLLLPKLERDSGLTDFRALDVDAPPTLFPLHPASSAHREDDAPLSPETLVEEDAARERARAGEGAPPQTASGFTRRYRRGLCTPEDVAERYLSALADSDSHYPPLRAVIRHDARALRRAAKESAARWRAGQPLSSLDGVPVVIKDELQVAGLPMSVGTRFLGTAPETEDATVVARLRAAGALIAGVANMHEIGIGVTGLNLHHGTPRNPYGEGRARGGYFTGGSSSGSAAAVAAGLCPLAIGADGGGSIRIPAALCGVVGLKPTWGRVSHHGCYELAWSVGHIGPIAATVRDCALLYAATAGPDQKDSYSRSQPAPGDLRSWLEADSLEGLRVGVYRPYFSDAEPEVVEACERALARLERDGATVHEITVRHLERCRVAHMITISSEMAAAMAPLMAAHGREFGYDVRINLAVARSFTATDYVKAQRVRTQLSEHMTELLAPASGVDLIVTPTTGCVAPPIRQDALAAGESDLETLSRIMRFAAPANLTGFPAISVPVGYDGQGLPIGLQLLARPWEENLLIKAGSMIERHVARRRPPRRYDLLDPWPE